MASHWLHVLYVASNNNTDRPFNSLLPLTIFVHLCIHTNANANVNSHYGPPTPVLWLSMDPSPSMRISLTDSFDLPASGDDLWQGRRSFFCQNVQLVEQNVQARDGGCLKGKPQKNWPKCGRVFIAYLTKKSSKFTVNDSNLEIWVKSPGVGGWAHKFGLIDPNKTFFWAKQAATATNRCWKRGSLWAGADVQGFNSAVPNFQFWATGRSQVCHTLA